MTIEEISIRRLTPCDIASKPMLYSELVYKAVPQFYGLIPGGHQAALGKIAAQLGKSGTELENCYCCSRLDTDLAVMTALPAERLAAAQRASLFDFMRGMSARDATEFATVLKKLEGDIEAVNTDGLYLARLGAVDEPKAFGAGTRMLRLFLAQSDARRFTLHVHRDNSASWLYRKLGFRFVSASPHQFRSMILER